MIALGRRDHSIATVFCTKIVGDGFQILQQDWLSISRTRRHALAALGLANIADPDHDGCWLHDRNLAGLGPVQRRPDPAIELH